MVKKKKGKDKRTIGQILKSLPLHLGPQAFSSKSNTFQFLRWYSGYSTHMPVCSSLDRDLPTICKLHECSDVVSFLLTVAYSY